MAKKKPKVVKLKNIQMEATALLHQALAKAFARGQNLQYRLKVPYGPIVDDQMVPKTQMIVDFMVYFDGELYDATNEPTKTFKITGPNRDRH